VTIIGILTLPSAKPIFETKYTQLCSGTLAECIMRDCRVFLKSKKMSEINIFFKLFDIKNSTNVFTYKCSIETIAEKTNKFFNKKFSNCSPFATVSALEFLQYYHTHQMELNGKLPDIKTIVELFLHRIITMKKFLTKVYGDTAGYIVQLALFIQGIKYNKSKIDKILFLNRLK
jgi:hypothetical protein